MATIERTAMVIEDRIGFPAGQTLALIERLREAALIADDGHLDIPDLVVLIVALGAGIEPDTVSGSWSTARYLALMPHGIDPAMAPPALRKKLELGVVEIVLGAYFIGAESNDIESQRDLSRLQIEFVANWPEIAIHHRDGVVDRFREVGALADRWGHHALRKSLTIDGSALVDAIRDLFTGD